MWSTEGLAGALADALSDILDDVITEYLINRNMLPYLSLVSDFRVVSSTLKTRG